MAEERADIASVFGVLFWMTYTFVQLIVLLILLIAQPIITLRRRPR